LEDFLEEVVEPTIPVLPYDDRAAVWHAAERARLENAGRPAPFVDGQIAATAFVNGLTLVTDNLKDFGAFRGIKLVNWLAE
jgi:tRNA(fMet)-specific endonuclease VapC